MAPDNTSQVKHIDHFQRTKVPQRVIHDPAGIGTPSHAHNNTHGSSLGSGYRSCSAPSGPRSAIGSEHQSSNEVTGSGRRLAMHESAKQRLIANSHNKDPHYAARLEEILGGSWLSTSARPSRVPPCTGAKFASSSSHSVSVGPAVVEAADRFGSPVAWAALWGAPRA